MTLEKEKKDFLKWYSQRQDLNPIEMLSNDLKGAFHTRHPTNVRELKQFWKDKWSKIPPENYLVLIQG